MINIKIVCTKYSSCHKTIWRFILRQGRGKAIMSSVGFNTLTKCENAANKMASELGVVRDDRERL